MLAANIGTALLVTDVPWAAVMWSAFGAAAGTVLLAVIAVLVALKGIGRFTELATPAARERFIVGTLASLLWACAVSAIVPLALW